MQNLKHEVLEQGNCVCEERWRLHLRLVWVLVDPTPCEEENCFGTFSD